MRSKVDKRIVVEMSEHERDKIVDGMEHIEKLRGELFTPILNTLKSCLILAKPE